ncbi:SH3 and PX domain-containing protein 2A [Anabarilius grahami]|uniref:SH3 and PX domain-containing protein 2A n=1 Tax=Anabarilius grahami TaxID=495550 RepID=A0A3N0YK29_ANAGA|nr:SH3 and PX domain-containing protein 2A [Anabarilius grahami]
MLLTAERTLNRLDVTVFRPWREDVNTLSCSPQLVYLINVTYSDSTSHVIYRRYSKFFDLQYEAEQGRVLWELNEAAGAIAQHMPHEQRDFYYATVAGAASAFPVMIRALANGGSFSLDLGMRRQLSQARPGLKVQNGCLDHKAVQERQWHQWLE